MLLVAFTLIDSTFDALVDILLFRRCRIFVLAGAELLSAIQILVYLGSVMLVVQFGVMLTRRQIMEEASNDACTRKFC